MTLRFQLFKKDFFKICQKEHRSELLKHFRRQVRYVEKRLTAPVFFLKRISLFFSRFATLVPSTMQNYVPLHARFTKFKSCAIVA